MSNDAVAQQMAAARAVYLAKFGSFFLLPHELSGEVERRGAEPAVRRIHAKVVETIEKAPNAVALHDRGSPMANWIFPVPSGESERMSFGLLDPLWFDAFWPRKNWEIPKWYSGYVPEQLRIAFDGSTFAVVARLVDPPPFEWSFEVGREARKVLKAVLEPSAEWESELIGPTPMFPAFYFAFVDRDAGSLPSTHVIAQDEVVTFLPYQGAEECVREVTDAIQEAHWCIVEHYLAIVARARMIGAEEDLTEHLRKATSLQKTLLSQPVWHPKALWVRPATIRELRRALVGIYEAYVELSDIRGQLTTTIRENTDHFATIWFLAPVSGYTQGQVRDVMECEYGHVLQAAKFYEEETRSVLMQSATIQAAVLGGLLVLAATAVILLLS